MDMIGRKRTLDDLNAKLGTYLMRNIADAQPHGWRQNLVSIFRNPDNVIAIVKGSVAAS